MSKYFTYLLSLAIISVGFSIKQEAAADETYVYCYGVKNSGAPLNSSSVKGTWAINPASITNYNGWYGKYTYGSYFSPNGNWGDPNNLTGTTGATGWMNYFRLTSGTTITNHVMAACKAAFLNPKIVDSNNIYYLNGPLYGNYTNSPFSASDINANLITILPVASSGIFQYPIIENNKVLSFFSNQMQNISDTTNIINTLSTEQNYFNYANIYTFVLASYLAYNVENLPPNPSLQEIQQIAGVLPAGFTPFQAMTPNNAQDPSNIYSYAIALKNDSSKIILISYKGTSNLNDVTADIQLMASDNSAGTVLGNYILSAYNFYYSIKHNSSYNGYKIILTGHSLGGFIATQVAVRSGELARVFSSPSNFLTATKFNIGAAFAAVGYLPLPNILCFGRSEDPIMDLSQNPLRSTPVNATIYFPPESPTITAQTAGAYNHVLSVAIPNIYSPYYTSYMNNNSSFYSNLIQYQNNGVSYSPPISYLYIYPDTDMSYISGNN